MLGASGATFGLVQDLHNDVVGVLDAGKNLVERYEYDIYGARTKRDAAGVLECSTLLGEPCVSGVGNTLGYTGRSLSRVTGFYDMRARMYSPALRVFTSRDPLGFVDSYDLWAYTSGDPLNFWDPFGLAEVERPSAHARMLEMGVFQSKDEGYAEHVFNFWDETIPSPQDVASSMYLLRCTPNGSDRCIEDGSRSALAQAGKPASPSLATRAPSRGGDYRRTLTHALAPA